MGNWKLTRAQEPTTLSAQTRREMRNGAPAGLSRRQLIRRSLGAGVGLWLLEVEAGTIGFLWPNLSSGFGGQLTLGDYETVSASPAVQGITLKDGAPAYFSEARAYIQLIDISLGFQDGDSPDGSGSTTNVRTLYQRCPHRAASPTSARATTGSSARATGRAMTGSASRSRSSARRREGSIGSRARSRTGS
ncbi:MAG: hypothetical protein R3C32_05415 [Chloroflexota bacterium]